MENVLEMCRDVSLVVCGIDDVVMLGNRLFNYSNENIYGVIY